MIWDLINVNLSKICSTLPVIADLIRSCLFSERMISKLLISIMIHDSAIGQSKYYCSLWYIYFILFQPQGMPKRREPTTLAEFYAPSPELPPPGLTVLDENMTGK